MAIEYSIVTLVVALVYALVVKFLPDLPIPQEVFQVVILYLLSKIGIEVIGKPIGAMLRARMGIKPAAKAKG